MPSIGLSKFIDSSQNQVDTSATPLPVAIASGGGGAVTIADGADVAEGAIADAAATQGGAGTVSAKLRTVTAQLNTLAGYLDGVETLLTAGNASTASIDTKASLLATAAKQPALGTATAPSADVITTERPAVTQVISTALETSKVLKASAGQIWHLSIFNSSASAQFVLLMNSITVPANGAVTLLYPPIAIAAGATVMLDFLSPIVASTGIAVSNSSTGSFTKTIGSADCAFYAQVN